MFPVLKGAFHVDDKVVFEAAENPTFIENRVNRLFRHDSGFAHFLKREILLFGFVGDYPDASEASLAYNHMESEVAFVV